MHMALLGPVGLEQLSTRVLASTIQTMNEISSLEGVDLAFPDSPVFREFAIKIPGLARDALSHMDNLGVTAGFDLGNWWGDKSSWILVGCDERTSESDISALKEGLSSWMEALE